VFFSCQAEHDAMRGHGGSIVNIASMSGHIVNRGVEWADSGVRPLSGLPGHHR
jgi:NAD(P)-dependent dehydrogenase (short-subunit alcohol dehydrogenase family)